jgi:hypothetical protein
MTLRVGLPFVVPFGLEMSIFEEKPENLKKTSIEVVHETRIDFLIL